MAERNRCPHISSLWILLRGAAQCFLESLPVFAPVQHEETRLNRGARVGVMTSPPDVQTFSPSTLCPTLLTFRKLIFEILLKIGRETPGLQNTYDVVISYYVKPQNICDPSLRVSQRKKLSITSCEIT